MLRDAITEKETLLSDVQRVQAVLRSALSVVNDAPTNVRASAPVPEPLPAPAEGAGRGDRRAGAVAPDAPPRAPDEMRDRRGRTGSQTANWPIGDRPAEPAPSPFELPARTSRRGRSGSSPARASILRGMEPRRIRLDLRVSPGATRSAVVGRHGRGWKLRVAAPPEGGRANASVVDLLATSLDVRRPDVRIVAGAGSRDKVVEISGLTLEEAERRLEQAGRTVR